MAASAVCNIDGCDKPVLNLSKGWCGKHYQRWLKNGDPTVSLYDREWRGKPCRHPGCQVPPVAKGLCQNHRVMERKRGAVVPHEKHRRRAKWIEANASHKGDECLIWPFSVSKHGRGLVTIGGRHMSAPRAMCILAHGEPPTAAHEAAHQCGAGHLGCMNPQHLRWATHAENEADKVAHGTARRGERVNTAVLTESDVKSIRASTASAASLAARHGVSKACIYNVRKRRSWAWLN